ncbi:hypothetical protein [Niabella beijingensis]|uniref:hypothetical protein n=1 Tax=Niabella beijingensis TaxID=2872700 RepID=UPI001CC14969|nr:hypothetical protein [Niabella beijingensis]MBZ4188318.1 hypothetical protein [Niabella beijingensis]
MNYLWGILIVAALAGCAEKTIPATSANGATFSAALHEKITYGDLTIAVSGIRESRCPMNARCIRAGEAIATLALEGSADTLSLCTGPDCRLQQRTGQDTITSGNHQYELTLSDIVPNPASTLKKGLQKAVFAVRKLQ